MIFETVQEWAHCREDMLKAIERTDGTHTEDDVLEGIITGKFQFWREGNSAAITEFVQFPRMKTLNIFLGGGRLEDIPPIKEKIYKFAVANGCARITALFAREGWERILADGEKIGEVKMCGRFGYRDL